jgi:hypothetical protein
MALENIDVIEPAKVVFMTGKEVADCFGESRTSAATATDVALAMEQPHNTINGHRNIRIMLGGGKSAYKDKSTTFWLASESDKNKTGRGLRPFGWTVLEPLKPEMDRQLRKAEEDFAHQEMLAKKQRLDQMAARREREAQKKRDCQYSIPPGSDDSDVMY